MSLRRISLGALLGLALAAAPHVVSAADGALVPGEAAQSSGGSLPGFDASESLRRSLDSPTARSRWNGLAEFGRDLFIDAQERFSPVTEAPVGPDYVLGPGDQLVVFQSTFADTSFTLTLDRDGMVFVPRVGSTALWGLTFAQAEATLRQRLGSVLRNARLQISMGRMRTIDVFVLGAVAHPGKVTLSGNATAFYALTAAGGPAELGSLRDIRILRANREVAHLDLYPFLLAGDRSNDVRLTGGDVVFVGLARARVGIDGAVVRPAVYESDERMTLARLLAMAGGPTAFADLSRIRIERVDANGGFRLQDFPLDHGHGVDPDTLLLAAYDRVTVLPLAERQTNQVVLDGYVRHPGAYEWTPGLRLSQLVTRDRLLPEASIESAELRRVDPGSFHVEIQSFSPRELWEGKGDLVLRPLDAVSVFSSARLPRSVTLEGEVARPGVYSIGPGERLSSVLERAGGVTSQGWLPASVFLRPSAARRERQLMNDFSVRQRADLARRQMELSQGGDSTDARGLAEANAELLSSLDHQTDPGRVVLSLDPAGRWRGTREDPELEDGDRLRVPLRPSTVTVLGNVMNPGTVLARAGAGSDTYLKLAGGAAPSADWKRSYVVRANGAAVPRSAAGRIQAGDVIVVPPRITTGSGLGRALGGVLRVTAGLAGTAAIVLAVRR
ncbi:MAG: SLBB domain-containing protein [Candidatus Eisenbacteria bacterium]